MASLVDFEEAVLAGLATQVLTGTEASDMLLEAYEDVYEARREHTNYDKFSLENFSDVAFKNKFRFNKSEIPELLDSLRLPVQLWSPQGSTWGREEGLCAVLRRLSYPNRLSDLVPDFGRAPSELSLIVNGTIEKILENNAHHLNRLIRTGSNMRNSQKPCIEGVLLLGTFGAS